MKLFLDTKIIFLLGGCDFNLFVAVDFGGILLDMSRLEVTGKITEPKHPSDGDIDRE